MGKRLMERASSLRLISLRVLRADIESEGGRGIPVCLRRYQWVAA